MATLVTDQHERVGRWVTEKAGGYWVPGSTGIALEHEGELVAGIMYDSYTGASIAMHSRVDDPTRVNRAWLFAIFDYPFNQLGVKRATGLVSSANEKAQQVNEHLGWVRETTLSDYFPDGDGIVYVMRKDNCRWIRGKR